MKCRKPGVDVDYLVTALKLAGLEAEVIPFDYHVFTAIDMIRNGSADITVHAIIQNPERLKLVDFTIPINYVVYGYMVTEDEEFQIKDFILNSFQPVVLFLLLIALFISSFAFWFFSKRRLNQNFWGWVLISWRILLTQDTPHHKIRYTLANALFLFSWIWFCFFFTQYFETAMTSALTLSTKKGYDFVNLDGLLDAVERKGWRIRLEENGYNPMNFCKPTHNQCKRLERALKQAILAAEDYQLGMKFSPQTVMFAGMHENLIQTDVVVMDKANKILFIKDSSIQPSHLAFALNKDLPRDVLEKLNRGLETIQGSYANFAGRYAHPYIPYRRSVHSSSEFYELGLIYLWPLFRLCVIFIGCSIGVLFVEILLGCRSRASYNLAR